MINSNMKSYAYYMFDGFDTYGQSKLSEAPVGNIKLSISLLNKSTKDNVLFADANYMALTMENITDKYVIDYGEVQLRVLYVNPYGRYKQVYLKVI